MSNLLLLVLMIVIFGYWIYKVTTYNWDNFEEDSKHDDFLKPVDNNSK